jgi:hypothetical protein
VYILTLDKVKNFQKMLPFRFKLSKKPNDDDGWWSVLDMMAPAQQGGTSLSLPIQVQFYLGLCLGLPLAVGLIKILLVRGGVEKNPGPATTDSLTRAMAGLIFPHLPPPGWIKFKFVVGGGGGEQVHLLPFFGKEIAPFHQFGEGKCTFCHFGGGMSTILPIWGSKVHLPLIWGRKVYNWEIWEGKFIGLA